MIGAIITIIIGMIVAFMMPEWIKFGDRKARSTIQLICNVIGIIIIIAGVLELLSFFGLY